MEGRIEERRLTIRRSHGRLSRLKCSGAVLLVLWNDGPQQGFITVHDLSQKEEAGNLLERAKWLLVHWSFVPLFTWIALLFSGAGEL